MREEVLRLSHVTYQEQGNTPLRNFNLNIFAGEIMGLIPLNCGYSMTALTELLRRNLPLQAGDIYYREELLNTWRAPAPRYNQIGVIQSDSCLVEGLTVADNIFVLRPAFRTWLIRPRILRQQLQPVLDSLDAGISADAYVGDLTHFQRFIVELVKAIVAGCRLVILREVSTFISDSELSRLHRILRHYAGEGVSFLYLGFHFEELTRICDRTALFSNGHIVKVLEHEAVTAPMIDSYDSMVRRQLHCQHSRKGQPPVLKVEELSGGAVEGLSFSVAPGECVVLQDLQNRVFQDLEDLFSGELPIETGQIYLDGAPYAPGRDRRIAVIQERPDRSMIFPQLSCLDNLGITLDHRLPELWRSARVQRGLRRVCAETLGEEMFLLPPERLSVRQKYDLVYQRVLLQNPKVVFCVQPFQGADLEMRIHIWKLLEQLLKRGMALIILAINLADSLSLASRLIRIRQGAPSEIYEQSEFGQIPFNAPWVNLYRGDGDAPEPADIPGAERFSPDYDGPVPDRSGFDGFGSRERK